MSGIFTFARSRNHLEPENMYMQEREAFKESYTLSPKKWVPFPQERAKGRPFGGKQLPASDSCFPWVRAELSSFRQQIDLDGHTTLMRAEHLGREAASGHNNRLYF